MDDEIRRLRAEARRLARGKHPSQVRYPDRFRRAAVALARRRLGPEGSVARLARDVGVSEPTLTKWLRPRTQPVLRPVAVLPAAMPAHPGAVGPVLITPKGVRVRGLDHDTLVAVLQALG
jgi:hypothetical protein